MKNKSVIDQSCFLLASGFGTGFLPLMPGTWASLFAIMGLFFLPEYSLASQLVFAIIFFLVGVATVSVALKNSRDHDPSWVVIDEFWGMGIAVIGLPKSLIVYVAAFILFRLFDIKKIFLVGHAQRIPGAWGVMLDDGVAGIFTLMGVHIFWCFFY